MSKSNRSEMKAPRRIPVRVAKEIAEKYGYSQVIILARYPNKSHATTYGKDKEHCRIAGLIGKYFLDLEGGKGPTP